MLGRRTSLAGTVYQGYDPFEDVPQKGEFDWGGFARNLAIGLGVAIDVYKRQYEGRELLVSRKKTELAGGEVIFTYRLAGNSYTSVSYTHLDVYKRQGQKSFIWNILESWIWKKPW